ncbi:MAG: DUF4962 domain-containing protein, partial [Planctomycetota bacterium]
MSIRTTALCFCAASLLCASTLCLAQARASSAEGSRSRPQALHPMTRQTSGPQPGREVDVNPPSLLWPAVKKADVRYRVRLSRDPQFQTPETIISRELPWAIFNPHAELARGKWYWRYEVVTGGKVREESERYDFIVTDSARTCVTASAEQMLSACPKSHPRILITSQELAAFRRRVKDSQEAESIIRAADRFIGREPPAENSGRPRQKGKNAFEQRNYAKWAGKALGNQLSAST